MQFDIKPFLHQDDPWQEEDLQRSIYLQKYRIAAVLQPKSILEIGVRAGYSAASFLSACPSANYVGIDADIDNYGGWPGSPHLAARMLERCFPGRTSLKRLNTQHLFALEGTYDLVHVDGDHSYQGALHDLRLASKVATWVLVDDVDWLPDVRRAVKDFLVETGFRSVHFPTVRGDVLIQCGGQRFCHGGDVGDLIYALPTVKQLGGGQLRLRPVPFVRERFTAEKVESLRPLLERQPYITKVDFFEELDGTNLDNWRNKYRSNLNIADMVADAFGVPHYPRDMPWLFCDDPNRVARVVVSRSPRYHSKAFPWKRVWDKYHSDAVFVGHGDEHETWQNQFGPINFCPTADWWELCRVIAGCDLFVGNQSAPMSLALALHVPLIVQEIHGNAPNCHFQREGAYYGSDDSVILPDLPT